MPNTPEPNNPNSGKQIAPEETIKVCPSCGNEIPIVAGRPLKCGCGWSPRATQDLVTKLFFLVVIIGAIAAGAWFMSNYYQFLPDNKAADTFLREGDDYLVQSHVREAITSYKSAARVSPKRADIHLKMSRVLSISEPSEALEQARIAKDLAPDDFNINENFIGLTENLGKLEDTAPAFEHMLAKYPKNLELLLQAGTCYKNLKKLSRAEDLYATATKVQKSGDLSWSNLVTTYKEDGKTEQAIETAKQGLIANPNSAMLNLLLGQLYTLSKNPDAVMHLTKAAELDPGLTYAVSPLLEGATKNGGRATYLIPMVRRGNNYLVDAVINDKYHVWMIVDTGAEACVLPTRTGAWPINSLDNMPHLSIGGITGTSTAPVVLIPSLRVGQAEVKNVVTIVYDMPGAEATVGLLGITFLQHFEVHIDTKRSQLMLIDRISKLLKH